MPPVGSPAVEVFRGSNKITAVCSCRVTPDDLRRLFALLQQKAREAAEKQVASLSPLPGQSGHQFDAACADQRRLLELTVRIQAENGEWIGGQNVAVLSDESIPSGVTQVDFDSAFLYRNQFKLCPNYFFIVALRFSRTNVFDLNAQPTVIESTIQVAATDRTWAKGVEKELSEFFQKRRTLRGWLHTSRTYDAFLFTVGLPFALSLVYWVNRIIKPLGSLPAALSVAIYVYLSLLALYIFRLSFNYWRWVYPKTELDAPYQNVAKRHVAVLAFIGATIAGILVERVVRLFGP